MGHWAGVSGTCVMRKAVAILLLGGFALTLAGCAGPCGFIWDNWRWSRSCGDTAPPK